MRLAREAREVAGRDVFVAGSIGPLGELEVFDPAEHGPLYAAQARVLEGRGVDLFMVETFFDLEELVVAVEAVRGVSSLPIVALLTFDDDAETRAASAPRPRARLAALDVAAIGTNPAPGRTSRSRPFAGWAAAGFRSPRCRTSASRAWSGGRVVYPHSTPDYFAEFAVQARRARRTDRRRLLRDDPSADRGDARGVRRGAGPARRSRSTSRARPAPPR